MLLDLGGKQGCDEIGGDRRGRQRRRRCRPDCACAAWSRSRRGRAPPARTLRRLRSASAARRRARSCRRCRPGCRSAAATSASRSRWVCQGASGKRQVEQRREPLGDAHAAVAERRKRAGGAAELQRQRLAAQPQQPLARARQRRGIAGELEPERHRQCVLQPGARHRGVRRWRPASVVKPSMARSRSAISASIASRSSSTSAVSMTSWLVAPQCTKPAAFVSLLATSGGQRFDQRRWRCCRTGAALPRAPRCRSARRCRPPRSTAAPSPE